MLGGEGGHRFLTLITRRNLNCHQERRSISGKGNLHAKATTWNEAECSEDKQDEVQETRWLGRKRLGQGHTVRAQSVREGSGKGSEIAAPRTGQERGHSGKQRWDRVPPLFQGKMPLLAPLGWEARLGDLLQNTEQGSIVKDCI